MQSPSDARRLIAAEQALVAAVLVRGLAEPAELEAAQEALAAARRAGRPARLVDHLVAAVASREGREAIGRAWADAASAAEDQAATLATPVVQRSAPTYRSAVTATGTEPGPASRAMAGSLVGLTIGSYQVERELGRGGMGAVWVARHVVLDRRVALKTLLPGASAGPEEAARFEREARAVAKVQHPNIVVVHDAGQVDSVRFLAMDLVEGESLRARIARDGPLPPDEVARLGAALADALAAAHAQGVLHRDLKPHNVLLAKDGAPRLVDFGLAWLAGQELTTSGQTLGTPAYVAPEQASGEAVDARADVYGLGATLYEALCGEAPFTGATALNILHAVLTRSPPPLVERRPDVPPALAEVVHRCLEKEPGARFASAAEVGAALAALVPGAAPPPGRPDAPRTDAQPRERARRSARPRPPAARSGVGPRLALAAVALAVGAGVLLFARGSGPAGEPGVASVPTAVATKPSPTRPATGPAPETERPALPTGGLSGLRPATEAKPVTDAPPATEAKAATEAGPPSEAEPPSEAPARAEPPPTERPPREPPAPTEPPPATEAPEPAPAEPPAWFAKLAKARRPTLPLPTGLAFGPGEGEYTNRVDGSVLVWVPPAKFIMGADDHDEDARPAHAVRLTRGLFLGKHEVTYGQFRRYAAATGRPPPHAPKEATQVSDGDDYPIGNVSWQEAADYAGWAGLRLPTEAEWELGARGPDGRRYPWGDEPRPFANGNGDDGHPFTSPVGSFPKGASPYGCLDMLGNVAEWVSDASGRHPAGAVTDPTGPTPAKGSKRLVKGGNYRHTPAELVAAMRGAPNFLRYENGAIGFRVAR